MTSSEKNLLEMLLNLGNTAARRTRPERIEDAMRLSMMLMNADAVVALPPGNTQGERIALYAGSAAPAVLLPVPQGSEVARGFGQDTQPLLFADLSDDARGASGDDCPGLVAGPTMFVAVRCRGAAPGYLAIYRRRGRARFTAVDSRQILLLAAWLQTALDGVVATGAERLAITDDVTDVYNARFIGSALKRELRRAARFRQELSILVVELDPVAGVDPAQRRDPILQEMAVLLAKQMRSFDLLGRHNGDGFVVLLPQTPHDAAVALAERLRRTVEQHAFRDATPGAVTVSLGLAAFPAHGTDAGAMLAAAGRALASARERGMNRVETVTRAA